MMLTKTLPETSPNADNETTSLGEINEQVDERGFYLHEWISPEELRMSVQADYLSIIRRSSMPLAIVTAIFGFLGFGTGGILGAILAIFGILGFFYAIILFILIVLMLRKAYLYAKGADLVITDHHYVSMGQIVERTDIARQESAFSTLEKTFREPLLGESELEEYISLEKKNLFTQLKDIALGGGKVVQNLGRSRDAGGILIVLMIAGVLYGGMMAAVYFIGVFFVTILARVFSFVTHQFLLKMNNTEYQIQSLFRKIYESSVALKQARKDSVSLLDEAGRNEWKENLSKRLNESFELISETARHATDDSVKLREVLENSKYKEIFNFSKYGTWTKKQILTPLEEILELLEENTSLLRETRTSLDDQITGTEESSHRSVLMLQRDRIEVQIESFERVIKMIEGYREKLDPKK